MRYLILIFCGCLLVLIVNGVSGAFSPAEVVHKYCELDARGARVISGEYNKIRQLMAWEKEQVEPGWDCFKIIGNYNITSKDIDEKHATIDVKYDVIAMCCSDDFLEEKEYSEVETFNLVFQKGEWKIKEYVVYPRVYKKSVIPILEQRLKYLQENGSEENDKKAQKIAEFIKK